MKPLVNRMNESRTDTETIINYVASWLRQDKAHYKEMCMTIMNAMSKFLKEEHEDKLYDISEQAYNMFEEA